MKIIDKLVEEYNQSEGANSIYHGSIGAPKLKLESKQIK